jgi:phosphohistidine phosphatase SixA
VEADRLASFLEDKTVAVGAILQAPTAAARETARRVVPNLGAEDENLLLGPCPDEVDATEIVRQLGPCANENDTIVLVGHEPKVSRVIKALTGKNARRLDPGEGVCVTGTVTEFKRQRARVEWASRRIEDATLLKDKLQSKVSVSTFLAGFFIAVLVELLSDPKKLTPLKAGAGSAYMRAAAVVSFSVGLALLLVAVYVYDQLAMPAEFWKLMPERHKPTSADCGQFTHDYRLNGALYAYMLWTWKWIFTPAVWFGVVGFLALLVPIGDAMLRWTLIITTLVVLTLTAVPLSSQPPGARDRLNIT